MSDTNRIRVGKQERFRENKLAFTDIFGDPFGYPEPVEGAYNRLNKRSAIHAQVISDSVGATKNPARPSIHDFFCDCERVVYDVILEPETQTRFVQTYVTEETATAFTQDERTKLEQDIGARLRARKISPSTRYFTVVRKPTGGSAKRKQANI